MSVPASPSAFSRTQPAKFCPKSNTNRPGAGSVTLATRCFMFAVSSGEVCATSRTGGSAPTVAGVQVAEIGRASCRERVCQYVSIQVVGVSVKKKKKTYAKQRRQIK